MSSERFFKQALDVLENNYVECGYIINAYNKTIDTSKICPTITTRPEGFKTAIIVVVENKNE